MAYRMAWVFTSDTGRSTTALWVEDDPQIPRRQRRPNVGISLPSEAAVRAWAAEHDLPWDPPPTRRSTLPNAQGTRTDD